MKNLLLEEVEYKITETKRGVWKSFAYENGRTYHEFTSYKMVGSMPFVHITLGKCPETGKRKTAKGFIAIGLRALGVISIGLFAIGVISVTLIGAGIISIGEVAIGAIFGLGQLATGVVAIGQFAIGFYLGIGQFAAGYIAIGQMAFGKYALGQVAFGQYVYSMQRKDEIARQFFETFPIVKNFFTK